MIKEIPLQAIPDQTLDVTLGEKDCTIRVRQMGTRIYVSLWADDRLIVENSIGLVYTAVNVYPSQYFDGILFFYDHLGDEPPQWEGLGKRWFLLYVPESERRFARLTQEA